MPVLSNPVPVDRPGSGSAPLDDSLTSLHWLQNFSILGADPERPTGTGPESPSPQNRLPRTGTDPPCSPAAGDTAGDPGSPLASALVPVQSGPVELDFRTNPRAKPPFSYASLICMSMQASQQPKVTLSTIYNWITDNFCYYRHAEPSWQNSIRHNLSLNKCFKKVPRRKDEPGKGGFWQIDPQYADMFVNGIFKRRRMSANHYGGGGGTHRQNRQVQVYHNSHSACPYQVGGKWKQHSKAMRAMESPLLAMEANKADFLKGEFDLTSVFDDVLGGGCSTFEDLDINTALSSLGCETEVSMLGRQHSAGRWCGAGDVSHRQSCGYLDPSGALAESYVNLGELGAPQRPEQDQLPQGHLPLQHFDESAALFAEPPGDGVLQPWEVIKEEPQVTALTLDQGFGLYEGFFTEMQQWERVESFL